MAGVEVDEGSWWWPKGARATRDSIRYKVQFVDCQGDQQEIHVNTRYRPRPEASGIVISNGIRTYNPETLFDHKLAAMDARKEARDVFDLAFLSKQYGDSLTESQILKAASITKHMDRLERRLDYLLRFDAVLTRITTAENIVLEFREAIDDQFQQRRMKHPQQSVPISIPMTREIIALRRLLHGDETTKTKKNQSPRRRSHSEHDQSDKGRFDQHPDWFDR